MATYNYCVYGSKSPEYPERNEVDDGPCRLSWYLVKNETETSEENNDYKIVHAMDITKPDYANIFLNNTISYNTRKEKLIGKVIAAADNLEIIKANIKSLEECVEKPNEGKQYCLVQYCQTPQRLVHKIFCDNEVLRIQNSNYTNYNEIYIREGKKLYRGLALMRDSNRDNLHNKLVKLREKCSDVIRRSFKQIVDVEIDARMEPECSTWLLLQYSENLFDSIYTVMRYDSTQMLKGNMYPGLQAYFDKDDITYQAIILHKSFDEAVLLGALKALIHFCATPMAHS